VFRTAQPASQWSIRACQCQFCRAHGALTTSDPAGRLSFRAEQDEFLRRYRFGMKTADFLLCSRCGVYLGATIETARGAFGTINTLALVPPPAQLPVATPVDYGSERVSDRIGRREQRWTPIETAI
jgi:hypothetical protein